MLNIVVDKHNTMLRVTFAQRSYYWSSSPLYQACQKRRAQTERMLVPPPHHIEFVDDYVHKGGTQQGSTHLAPWLSISENQREGEGREEIV